MPFNRLQLRHLAACVLVGWLLALGVSVAHGCGLGAGLAHDRRGAGITHEHPARAPEPAAVAAAEQTPPADNASCAKFCDEVKNSATGGAGTLAAAAPAHVDSAPMPLARPTLASDASRAAWMHDRGRRPQRERSIELLRLTL